MYHLLVTLTLTSDQVFRIIMSEAYLIYIFEGRNPNFGVWMPVWIVEFHIPFGSL